MLRRELEPIVSEIISWSLWLIGISIGISVLSIFITVDLSQSNNPFLNIFILSLSNFSFFIGLLAICAGLLIIFFKKPETSSFSKERKKEFKPIYKKGLKETPTTSGEEKDRSNLSQFSKREFKLIFSGVIAFLFSIILWISYLILQTI